MIDIYKRIMQREAMKYYSGSQSKKDASEYKEILRSLLEKMNKIDPDLLYDCEKKEYEEIRAILKESIEKVKPRGLLWQILLKT